jgi:hypothetical protein
MKTTRKSVSLASDVSALAEANARKENRTLSNYINTLLRQRFESKPARRKSTTAA